MRRLSFGRTEGIFANSWEAGPAVAVLTLALRISFDATFVSDTERSGTARVGIETVWFAVGSVAYRRSVGGAAGGGDKSSERGLSVESAALRSCFKRASSKSFFDASNSSKDKPFASRRGIAVGLSFSLKKHSI